jgi:glutamyl-tRNA synthetase
MAASDPRGKRPRGRWAPTPSGELHLGNARTALAAWLSIRRQGGTFVWRLEDLDGPRTVPGLAEAAEADLAWLGLDWDEGPGPGGPSAPYVQSRRHAHYERALTELAAAGRVFPCRLSRSDLANLATAPHGRSGLPPYPARLRPREPDPDWLDRLRRAAPPDAAIRFRVSEEPVTFHDELCGEITERVDREVGDFVLKRRDGVYAYQLAVVVDDLAMAIDEVVRGRDLLESTARQIQLIEALGGRRPRYAHLPLVRNARGEKLSKRDAGLTLRSLREAGVDPRRLTGYLAWSLGLLETPAPRRPADLVADFAWSRVCRGDLTLPEDLLGLLPAVA